jgi:quinol-cytochrome oxidoreductase complex cytochrome b subunit
MRTRPSFFAHLHPPQIPAREGSLTYTWGLGGISLAMFLVLLVTGLLEMFVYSPNTADAYASVQIITFIAPYGWLVRNLHYWAAQGMVLSVSLHMARVVFSGGYKKRRFNYLLGVALLVLTLLADFTGYVLRWDDEGIWALTVGTNLIRSASNTQRLNEQIQLGERLFAAGTERAPACTLCHSLQAAVLVGPSLQHIATTAQTRVPGQSARDYIHTSILNPSAYKVPGFETGTMFPDYAVALSPDEVGALVAFLLTQK